jgi:hypothetical protein
VAYTFAFVAAVGAVGLATAALWLTGRGRSRVMS